MSTLTERLNTATNDPLGRLLVPVVTGSTGTTSAGYPYLQQSAYEHLRDRVPHTLGMGVRVWNVLEAMSIAAEGVDEAERHHFVQSRRVVQQVLRTAAITAPPSLWLMRHVIGAINETGVGQRLLAGERVVVTEGNLDPVELDTDLSFLSVMGVLERRNGGFTMADRPESARLLTELGPIPASVPIDAALHWTAVFQGASLSDSVQESLRSLGESLPIRTSCEQAGWFPQVEEVRLGARLVPIVIALAAAGRSQEILHRPSIRPIDIAPEDTSMGRVAIDILTACGVLRSMPSIEEWIPTPLGRRLLDRGPGPFGIIEAYHPYMQHAASILQGGRGSVHLSRSANIVASQRANRDSFRRANDALDAFCRDTGFAYSVFVEHALGRGEATRQRFVRSGSHLIQFVGADLEDAAIDAAMTERDSGHLPHDMVFVRNADIGKPAILIDAMAAHGIEPTDGVMIVGNGFHEIRDNTDDNLIAVLSAYQAAGLVLVFTEETALSIRDQRATAWNTYHPAFRYVHEKSGQGLRPTEGSQPDPDDPMPMSWTECCEQAGYVRLERYCRPGRTIYPCPPPDGVNASTYVNYFFIPRSLAQRLDLPRVDKGAPSGA